VDRSRARWSIGTGQLMAGRAKVTISGLDELDARLAELPKVIRRGALRATRAETHEVAEDMRANAPVLSGELKQGIQEEIDTKAIEGRAVSTARHTTFVIHGTSDTPANDFMEPAAQRSRIRYPKRAQEAVLKELRKVTE
jgi:HK97 gp10 family phage protein